MAAYVCVASVLLFALAVGLDEVRYPPREAVLVAWLPPVYSTNRWQCPGGTDCLCECKSDFPPKFRNVRQILLRENSG